MTPPRLNRSPNVQCRPSESCRTIAAPVVVSLLRRQPRLITLNVHRWRIFDSFDNCEEPGSRPGRANTGHSPVEGSCRSPYMQVLLNSHLPRVQRFSRPGFPLDRSRSLPRIHEVDRYIIHRPIDAAPTCNQLDGKNYERYEEQGAGDSTPVRGKSVHYTAETVCWETRETE